MGVLIKKDATLAIEIESVEGVDQGVPAATSFIQANADAVVMAPQIEELNQNLLGTGIGADMSLHGLKSGTGSVGMPLATNKIEGGLSPMGNALHSLLGSEKIVASLTTTAATTTLLTFAAPHNLVKNDIVIVKTAGAHEARVISDSTSTTITLSPALSISPDATTDIAAMRIYKPACNRPSLTLTEYLGACQDGVNSLVRKLVGAWTESCSVDNFVTGQLADITFAFQALKYFKDNAAPVAPSYTQANRSAVVGATIYQNGAVFKINEFGLAIQNTLSKVSDTKEGNTSIKATERVVTGKINPYMVSGADGLAQTQMFMANQPFSLMVVKSNPTAVEGENKNFTVFWMPNCQIQSIEDGDYNNFLTENISFKAFNTADEPDIVIAIS